jgi:hypothetical protein
MSGNQQPATPIVKRRDSLGTVLAILGGVLIPNLLRDTVHLPISAGNVIGLALAGTLGYLLLPEPKKNVRRYSLFVLGAAVLAWFVGYFLEK